MVTMTNTAVTREHVWATFRRAHAVRWRERDHSILLLMDGTSGPAGAPWRDRDEETIRSWVRAFTETGLPGLERASSPGRPT
jgi:transposase